MELEIKYKVDSFPVIQIEQMGFQKKKESHQIDNYYIVNKTLGKKRTYLRTRKDIFKNEYSFDLHQIISDIATDETEITLNNENDYVSIGRILEVINYPLECTIDKKRQIYQKDNIKIILDNVVNLGYFIEIEIIGNETIEYNNLLFEMANALSLLPENRVTKKGYPDLFLEIKNGFSNV